MKTVQVDLFSDVNCPWCFIGARRLAKVADELKDEIQVEVRHHPYRLMPEATEEGLELAKHLKARYGQDPRPMFDRVEAAARDAGIDLDLSKQKYAYDTTSAHTLLRHAGPRGTQAALADALFVAHFQDARNVADGAVLAEIASRHGFTPAEVEALLADDAELAQTHDEMRVASEAGVQGVPLFVLDNRFSLSGAQPEEVFQRALRQAAA